MIRPSYYDKFVGINEPVEPGYYWVRYRPFSHVPTIIIEIVRLEWLNTFEDGKTLKLHASRASGGPAWVKEFSQYEPARWGEQLPCPRELRDA